MSDRIPGTRVPDNAIHRASLWVEALKFAPESRLDAEPQRMTDDDFTWRAFVEGTDLPVTVEELQEAAVYYGTNLLEMVVGNRINFVITGPDGQPLDGRGIFASLWLDAFMHGVATAQGRHGESNEEAGRRG